MTNKEKYLDFILEDIKRGVEYNHPNFLLFGGITTINSSTAIPESFLPESFSHVVSERYGATEKEVKLLWEDINLYLEDFSGYGGAVNRELMSRMEKDAEEESKRDDDRIRTTPEKGIVAPSSIVINNVCEREKFCNAQGKITFGQLASLVKAAKQRKIGTDVGGGYINLLLDYYLGLYHKLQLVLL
jgi:hypothetical protein